MTENTHPSPSLIVAQSRFPHPVAARAESRVCGLPRHTSDANFAALFTAKSLQTRVSARGRARVAERIIQDIVRATIQKRSSGEVMRGEKAMEFDGAAGRI
jgi:hypothetical protein